MFRSGGGKYSKSAANVSNANLFNIKSHYAKQYIFVAFRVFFCSIILSFFRQRGINTPSVIRGENPHSNPTFPLFLKIYTHIPLG